MLLLLSKYTCTLINRHIVKNMSPNNNVLKNVKYLQRQLGSSGSSCGTRRRGQHCCPHSPSAPCPQRDCGPDTPHSLLTHTHTGRKTTIIATGKQLQAKNCSSHTLMCHHHYVHHSGPLLIFTVISFISSRSTIVTKYTPSWLFLLWKKYLFFSLGFVSSLKRPLVKKVK